MRSVSGLILALLGATGVAAAEEAARPVDVHFTSRATVVDGAAIKAELEQAYTAQYGKDQGKWPRGYASAPPKALADSARDLAKAAGAFGGGLLRVVEGADEADLVVEVTGRHSSRSEFWFDSDDQFGFILRLSAGGKMAEGRLRGAVARWPEDKELDVVVVDELHGYSDEEPYWLLRMQGGGSWGSLTNRTAGILADFVRTNGSLFAGR